MPRTAIQLQTLDGVDRSLPELIGRVGETSLDGVEFAGLGEAEPTAIASALDAADLDVVGAHVPIDRFEADYDEVIESHRELGCTRLIVPGRDPETFGSGRRIEALADRLTRLEARVADDGFDLAYHNHRYEFSGTDGSPYEAFAELIPGVDLEIDTGLAGYGGADPVALLRRYADRTPVVHLTDSVEGTAGTAQVELGAGLIDVEGCVAECLASETEWLVYEHGRTNDPFASLHHGATFLEALIEKTRRKQAV